MAMRNITLSIDEATLEAVCAYARRHKVSVSQLTRELLRDKVMGDRATATRALLRVMRAHQGDSRGWTWSRADVYED